MREYVTNFLKNEDGFIGALIGAGASLLGASKARKAARYDNQIHFQTHRASAEAAGFNPLTALEATGGSFGGSGGPPPLASAELIADAVTSIHDEFTGRADEARKRVELENDLLEIQVEQLRSGVAPAAQGPAQLNTRGNAATRVGTTRRSAGTGEPYTQGNPAFDMVGNPLTPSLTFGGRDWQSDPDTSDAEVFEQRYGDIGGSVAGAGVAFNDFNYYPNRINRIQRRDAIRADQQRIGQNADAEDAIMALPLAPARMQRLDYDPRFGTGPIRSVAPTQTEVDEYNFRRNATR
jgi:hypothetical protein